MKYHQVYSLILISLLLGLIQLHPLYAQERDGDAAPQAAPQAEEQMLREDIQDSSASTKSEADRADAVEVDDGEVDGDKIEIKESDSQEIMQRMEDEENRVRQSKQLSYEVVGRLPHRPTVFTQGLIVDGDILVESSGGYGRSLLSKISLESGEVLSEKEMLPHIFAEGVTNFKGLIYQLTYRAGTVMVYNEDNLRFERQHQYSGEGWGLTNDGKHLIMSDGTDVLKYMDHEEFKEIKRVSVTENGKPLKYINELEWVQGKIYANVWLRNKIVIINPETGVVHSHLDLKELLEEVRSNAKTGVLNGIAYDAKNKRLYVTGKYWPTLFEIKIGS